MFADRSQGASHDPAETQISDQTQKKIAAAVYLYQVDNDGEWGEISFDFEAGTAEIVRLAEWDTTESNIFAKRIIHYIFQHIGAFLSQRIPMIVFAP